MSDIQIVKPLIFLAGALSGPEQKKRIAELRLAYVSLTSNDNIVHCEQLADAASDRLPDWRGRLKRSRFYLERSDVVVLLTASPDTLDDELAICAQWANGMRKPVIFLPPFPDMTPPSEEAVEQCSD